MRIKRLPIILLLCLILLAGCSGEPRQEKEIWTMVEEKIITFSDGESVNLWRTDSIGHAAYKLSDETTLLIVRDPIGPANVYVGGVESFDDLCESTQRAVCAFYEEQGLLYNIPSELENAYTEYLACKDNGTLFGEYSISQDISPTASNDSIMCFLTSVILPVNGQMAQEVRLGAVFSRETGEVLNNWELFSLPEDEARQRLLDTFNVADSALRTEMKAALKPEYIILFPDNLEVTFPRGTLPSQEDSYSIGVGYDELQGVIQTWAVPNSDRT
ncbi:MAG TPA: hypothetical protein GX523_00575 [Desulfitobacterium dehalogenans]|uniref:DUF3298 domain-containing protein n=1 Tax=Desulfitobacterium dehalogenans TaxID=36854 RepID=A0A7C6Z263_9FIRM|nr:hypothetical protein [Desulfitobacterium dehalogenans]